MTRILQPLALLSAVLVAASQLAGGTEATLRFVDEHWAELPAWALVYSGGVFIASVIFTFTRQLILWIDWKDAGAQVLWLIVSALGFALVVFGPVDDVTMAVPDSLRLAHPLAGLQFLGLVWLTLTGMTAMQAYRERFWAAHRA